MIVLKSLNTNLQQNPWFSNLFFNYIYTFRKIFYFSKIFSFLIFFHTIFLRHSTICNPSPHFRSTPRIPCQDLKINQDPLFQFIFLQGVNITTRVNMFYFTIYLNFIFNLFDNCVKCKKQSNFFPGLFYV